MWIAVAKFIFSLLLSATVQEVFAPTISSKRDDENKDTLDQDDIPSADIGNPIPKVYGTRWVTSPNVVYWRKSKEKTINDIYIKYWVNMHLAVCHAPVTALKSFTMDKKEQVIPALLTASEITLSDPDKKLILAIEATSLTTGKYFIPTFTNGDLAQVEFSTIPEEVVENNDGFSNYSCIYSQASIDDWDVSKPRRLVLYYIEGATSASPDKQEVWQSTDAGEYLLIPHDDNPSNPFEHAVTFGNIAITLSLKLSSEPINGKYMPNFDIYLKAWEGNKEHEGTEFINKRTPRIFTHEGEYAPITPDNPQNLTLEGACTPLDLPNLFGGYKKGGGLVGSMCIVNGDHNPSSEISSVLKSLNEDQLTSGAKLLDDKKASDMSSSYVPFYPSVVSVILMDTYIAANRSHIAPMHFLVKDTLFLSLNGIFPSNLYTIGEDANPAAVLLDLLLNPIYGRGLTVDRIDLQSFIKAGNILKEEELAISVVFSGTKAIEDLMNIVCRHSFGTWRIKDNKIQFILYRAYDGLVESIPSAKPFKILSLRSNKGTDGLANRIKITWTETLKAQDISRTETVSSPLALSELDKYSTNTYTFKGCPTKKAARVLGELHLLSDKYILKVAEWEEAITEGRYVVGDFVRLPSNQFEDDTLIMRVTNIKIKGTKKVVTAIEDSFQNKLIEGVLPSLPFITDVTVDLSKGTIEKQSLPVAKNVAPTVFFRIPGGEYLVGDWFKLEDTPRGILLTVDKFKIPPAMVNGNLSYAFPIRLPDGSSTTATVAFSFSLVEITPEYPNDSSVIIMNREGLVSN